MILVGMIKTDEDAFICDMAETYNIYDYKSLPVRTLAILASGLRADSRIRMKISGTRAKSEDILLALIHDRIMDVLRCITGSKEDPTYLFDRLAKTGPKKTEGYSSPEEYEEARKQFVKGG